MAEQSSAYKFGTVGPAAGGRGQQLSRIAKSLGLEVAGFDFPGDTPILLTPLWRTGLLRQSAHHLGEPLYREQTAPLPVAQ